MDQKTSNKYTNGTENRRTLLIMIIIGFTTLMGFSLMIIGMII